MSRVAPARRPSNNSTPPIACSSNCSLAPQVSTSRCSPRSAVRDSCGGRCRPVSHCADRSRATSTCSMPRSTAPTRSKRPRRHGSRRRLPERGRPLEAAGLLLDAGAPDRAARLLTSLPESVTKSVEPRAMLSVLARLGTVTDSEPALLLLRANAASSLGRLDQVIRDADRAAALAPHADPPVRRRIEAAVARAEFLRGHRDKAIALANSGLRDIGPGEEHTFARAHEVLALATAASETRDDLQFAAESFRVAAAAWDACGESALARNCRCDLAMAVLIPLGRFDEALGRARPGPRRRRAQRRRAFVADDLRRVSPCSRPTVSGRPPDASSGPPTSATSRTTRRSWPPRRGDGR